MKKVLLAIIVLLLIGCGDTIVEPKVIEAPGSTQQAVEECELLAFDQLKFATFDTLNYKTVKSIKLYTEVSGFYVHTEELNGFTTVRHTTTIARKRIKH